MKSEFCPRPRRALLILGLGSLVSSPLHADGGANGLTERISFTSDGSQLSAGTRYPTISADGCNAGVAEVVADSGHVDSCLKERDGTAVAEDVRRDAFLREARPFFRCECGVLGQQVRDTISRHRLTSCVEKDAAV